VFLGPETEKIMMTGLHRVSDIHCKACMKLVGWTYVRVIGSFQIQYRSMPMSKAKNTKRENLLLRELMPSKLSIPSRIRHLKVGLVMKAQDLKLDYSDHFQSIVKERWQKMMKFENTNQ
jgi:hypothetical protein